MPLLVTNTAARLRLGSAAVASAYLGSAQIYPEGTPASLLLRFDGNLLDSSQYGLAVTSSGNCQATASLSRIGSGSAAFPGDYDDYLIVTDSPGLDLESGDWTVEFWFRPSDVGRFGILLSINIDPNSYGQLRLDQSYDQLVLLTYDVIGQYWRDISAHGTLEANVWHHIAATRSGSDFRLFLDGSLIHAYEYEYNLSQANGYHRIGAITEGDYGTLTVSGYIDDLRIIKGLAVYTSPFTPPQSPLSPYIQSTSASPLSMFRRDELLRSIYSWSDF